MEPHVLVVEQDGPDPADLKHHIECPGVSASCLTWWECMEEHDAEALWETGEAHGVEHQLIGGVWSTPGTQCIGHTLEYDLDGFEAPGRYPVTFEDAEEGFMYLVPVRGTESRTTPPTHPPTALLDRALSGDTEDGGE